MTAKIVYVCLFAISLVNTNSAYAQDSFKIYLDVATRTELPHKAEAVQSYLRTDPGPRCRDQGNAIMQTCNEAAPICISGDLAAANRFLVNDVFPLAVALSSDSLSMPSKAQIALDQSALQFTVRKSVCTEGWQYAPIDSDNAGDVCLGARLLTVTLNVELCR